MFEVYERAARQPAPGLQPGDALGKLVARKWRIEKRQVEGLRRSRQVLRRAGALEVHGAGIGAPLAQHVAELADHCCSLIDEHAVRGTARERFEAQRSGPGVQVEAAAPGRFPLQPVEQGLAHAIAGGTDIAHRELPAPPAPAAGNDAQATRLRTAYWAVRRCPGGWTGIAAHGGEAYRI